MYEHASTYNIKFGKVLKQLSAHCLYTGALNVNKWNKCCCYCVTCGTYLTFCRQTYVDQDSVYEDNVNAIIHLGF